MQKCILLKSIKANCMKNQLDMEKHVGTSAHQILAKSVKNDTVIGPDMCTCLPLSKPVRYISIYLYIFTYTRVWIFPNVYRLLSWFSLQQNLIFVKKTSFCLISVKASSGLRKMFSQYYYNQNGVWENVCLAILDTYFP